MHVDLMYFGQLLDAILPPIPFPTYGFNHIALNIFLDKSGVKRLNTLGHPDQYMAKHGRIVKQSYSETV